MNKIAEIRGKQNITLKELADKTGISLGYISHLENGSRCNPSKEVMGKISEALNKTVQELFFSEV